MTKDDIVEPLMAGFPPPVEHRVRFGDGSFGRWPQIRWSLSHMDELVPTRAVWCGDGASRAFDRGELDVGRLQIETEQGLLTWDEALDATFTDAIVVMHRGRLVIESYFGEGGPHQRHTLMSCNKSLVGLIAECLIAEGVMDDDTLVSSVLPELANSAWATATVRHVLDMRTDLTYTEDYADRGSDVWRFLECTGMVPPRPGHETSAISEVLPTFGGAGKHGGPFAYQEPNIFVLGWIVRRAAGQSLAELVSTRIWQRIGAEHDAYYQLDPSGAETTLASTARDLVKFGGLLLDGGRVGDEQVVPESVIAGLHAGGDREAFAAAGMATLPGWSYRSQWWIRHRGAEACLVARGAYGQMLVVDPGNEMVLVRFGSARQASSALLDPIVLPLVDAITGALADEA